jgi:hypothetical protein
VTSCDAQNWWSSTGTRFLRFFHCYSSFHHCSILMYQRPLVFTLYPYRAAQYHILDLTVWGFSRHVVPWKQKFTFKVSSIKLFIFPRGKKRYLYLKMFIT